MARSDQRKDGPAASPAGPFAIQRSVSAWKSASSSARSWLPYVLVAPQLAITIVFFFWPASQAILQSVQQQDPFGITVEFVGLDNFRALFADDALSRVVPVTAIFSVLVATFGMTDLAHPRRVRRPRDARSPAFTRRC